jgi:hypothetical protein
VNRPEDDIRGRDEIESLLGDVPEGERADLRRLAAQLSDRPIPKPALRAAIHRRIADGALEARPPRLGRLVAAYMSSGAFLLVVAAVGVAGVGPLAA